VLADIATYNVYLAQKLRSEYLRETGNSPSDAGQLSFESWDSAIELYPNYALLKARILYEAAVRKDLTRTFYEDAPAIGKSLLRSVATAVYN